MPWIVDAFLLIAFVLIVGAGLYGASELMSGWDDDEGI